MMHSEETCKVISIIDDATYCIKGPVCSGTVHLSIDVVPGGCPSRGDVAIKHCSKSYPSFVAGGNCVVPVDAHCVISAIGRWQCVYPDTNSLKSRNSSSDNSGSFNQDTTTGAATKAMPVSKLTTVTPALVHPVASAASANNDGMALSAKTEKTNMPSVSNSKASTQAPNASLNVIVAASCCVLGLMGLVFVKKRRNADLRRTNSALAHSVNSSVLVL